MNKTVYFLGAGFSADAGGALLSLIDVKVSDAHSKPFVLQM